MAREGIILFANSTFAEMVDYPRDRLAGLVFPKVLHTQPATIRAFWRRYSGESAGRTAGLCGLDDAGQDEQLGADAA
jgi:hypothetical protein